MEGTFLHSKGGYAFGCLSVITVFIGASIGAYYLGILGGSIGLFASVFITIIVSKIFETESNRTLSLGVIVILLTLSHMLIIGLINANFSNRLATPESSTNLTKLNTCLDKADNKYLSDRGKECTSQAKLIQEAMLNCVDLYNDISGCKDWLGTADASVNCSLPSATDQRLEQSYERATDKCYSENN